MSPLSADLARKRARIADATDPESIFANPVVEYYYSDDELRSLAAEFAFNANLDELGPVQRSHAVKAAFIEHLGYPRPGRFRGADRLQKPKFRAQLMDVFVQSSTNLQVWNYLPHNLERIGGLPPPWERVTYADCRYVIIPVRNGRVGHAQVVKGSELGQHARTGTLTIKYQATVPPNIFSSHGVDVVAEVQGNMRHFLGGRCDADEIAKRLEPLVGTSLPTGTERQIGQSFHRAVAASLGISTNAIDDGQFPDLASYLTEVKFQMSPTIDLGMVLPPSIEEARAGVIPAQVTYVVGIGNLLDRGPVVRSIVVVLGMDFEERFKIWSTQNRKIQIHIPATWLE